MSSIVPSAHVVKPTFGKQKETSQCKKVECECKSHNSEPVCHLAKHVTHEINLPHRMHRENRFSEENNRGPANCLRETNLKQRSTLFHCETVSLGNNIIEQNQVVCKFPPLTTDDDRNKRFRFCFKNEGHSQAGNLQKDIFLVHLTSSGIESLAGLLNFGFRILWRNMKTKNKIVGSWFLRYQQF